MSGFQYEKNLIHQERAIEAVVNVLNGAEFWGNSSDGNNIQIDKQLFQQNIKAIQKLNRINDITPSYNFVLDIAMETGTGKTYTYTKTMYELHRVYGVFKFIVVVPTLSIKAGTESFLKSTALAEHFRADFEGRYADTQIELYAVQSQKSKNKKQSSAFTSIKKFVDSRDQKKIHVLLINAGMINSDTMAGNDNNNDGSILFKDEFSKPFDAIASINPFVIIDEPHKFSKDKKTWENIQKFKPAFIIRYGATFNNQFENLLYRLTAIDAFNDNLVKGVNVFVQEIEGDNGSLVQLTQLSKDRVTFKLIEQDSNKIFELEKGDSLNIIHPAITDLWIEGMNKSTLLLSNGLELKKGDKLNPYSYDATTTDHLLRQAIIKHFDEEKHLLTRENGRIKPLTLFFIDNIESYRNGKEEDNSLLNRFEAMIKQEAQKRLTTENDKFYCTYLQKTLSDVSATHGGYFSKDNSDKDEKIVQEIQEILHDKQSLLSIDNPRRFIFSKWTLREGWDNPNVFGICKLRSSGSETSKLQEVGRGLRLPVNEYMARVKDEAFYLNYFVDSSERDFATQLIGEVNNAISTFKLPEKLNDELVNKIRLSYPEENRRKISNKLYNEKLIDDDENFIGENILVKIKEVYPLAFSKIGIQKNKIRNNSDKEKNTIAMRPGKYNELKNLWEIINQKAILQYNIDNEQTFLHLLVQYLKDNQKFFHKTGITLKKNKISVEKNHLAIKLQGSLDEQDFQPLINMSYADFLEQLSISSFIQRQTLHRAFEEVKDMINIHQYLNHQTINALKSGFNRWLLLHSLTNFEITYTKINTHIHPTKFTDKDGNPKEVSVSDLGTTQSEQDTPLPQYLFDKTFFDSELEKHNITQGEIQEIMVFTKIPKNSIKIPVAGGGSYSPDFAYIIKTSKGKILNLILETKNMKDNHDLRKEEIQKIKHAEKFFQHLSQNTQVFFKSQFEDDKVVQIIKEII